MIKGLIVLDENLASSIALRYAGLLSEYMPIQFKAAHVEDPATKRQSAGTGWVQRTWEKGIEEAGMQTVQRLIKTEKAGCEFMGAPRILIGDHDDELLDTLWQGGYELFLEGNLNTSNVSDFYSLITSKLYSKSPSPMLVVKNLVSPAKTVLICGEGVDPGILVPQFLKIANGATFAVDIVCYKFQENDAPVLVDNSEGGAALTRVAEMLAENGVQVQKCRVICGTPEQTADLFREYGLAVTTFPTRKSMRLELLAHIPTPVVLCR